MWTPRRSGGGGQGDVMDAAASSSGEVRRGGPGGLVRLRSGLGGMIGGGRSARAAGAGGRLRAVPSGAGRDARSVGPGEGRPAAVRPGADVQTAGPADAIRPRAMPPHITRGNASRAQVRVAIEHVFAAQRCRFRPVIRSVGMARARPSSGSPTWSPTCTASPGSRHGRFRPERRECSSTARHHAPAAPSTRNRTCRAQRRPGGLTSAPTSGFFEVSRRAGGTAR